MKYILKIIALQLCLISYLDAQIFGLQYREQFHYNTALSYPKDANYRVLALGAVPGSYALSKIFIYNRDFKLTDSVQLLKGTIPERNEPLKWNNKLYWPAVFWDTISNSLGGVFSVLELDTFYHHIALHKINTPYTGVQSAVNITRISNYFYCGFVKDYTTSIVYKLSGQFVKLDSVTFTFGISDLVAFKDKLILSGGGSSTYPCNGVYNGVLKTLILDTALNQTNCLSFDNVGTFNAPSGFPPQVITIKGGIFISSKTIPITNTKVLAAGYASKPSYQASLTAQNVLINCILNNNNQVLEILEFGSPTENTTYLDLSNFISVYKDEIMTTGSRGDDPQNIQLKSKIFVNKFDTLGNILWTKEYGGDMNYRANSIVFTRDGGGLISGWRFDTTTMHNINVWESFLLKVDKNGNFNEVGISKNETTSSQPIKCFPNPASDNLVFEFSSEANYEIKLYDVSNKQVCKLTDSHKRIEIDVSTLEPGVYFYKIVVKNDLFFGKFIKAVND